ncbi:alpha/beta fold hydrolase [Notoacmeibacter sp. MSK16QG-6]|uniref:alpha/beta fold hydrolase n=1 Tax=Notoacmeibacter sp. MSK16QG-6 TaxID=2957982 RepID=UPI00209F0F14|nr:alpha/beta fold hydrolase [Notoacmeibacter sp. MSK16QG-6]MCP1199908.1 alpha/beta fold hydrolase [Notoacmeibacter sp. MSK16QG-6]
MEGEPVHSLHAEHFGAKGGGEPLVLLHGFGGTHKVWRAVIGALARKNEGLSILAYDLPGHGANLDAPGAGPPKRSAELIAADLKRRGIERFHLAGHSMGGAIASLIAFSKPDATASLTLVAPGGFGPEIDIETLKKFAAAKKDDELRESLSRMSGPRVEMTDDDIAPLVAMRRQPGQMDTLKRIADGMTRDGKQGCLPAEWLEKLSMPVNLIWGTADSILPYRQTENAPAHFALHTLDGAGHMLPEERPSEVAQVLVEAIR